MARIHPDLVGSYRGRVGNASYYVIDDENFLRSLSDKSPKEGTEEQKEARTKCCILGRLSGVVKDVTKLGYPEAKNHANDFFVTNLGAVEVVDADKHVGSVAYPDLLVSFGTLVPVAVTMTSEENVLTFTYASMEEGYGLQADDEVYAAFVDEKLQFSWMRKLGTRGEGGMVSENVPSFSSKENLHVYTFVVTKDRKRASRSIYHSIA